MNTDLSGMSKAELVQFLDEAEIQIKEIRDELERRKEATQREAIDELELPHTRRAVDWREVKAFFQQVLDDLRSGTK